MNILPYNEQVAIITEAMRECDKEFETAGGSTRHYVMDLLLPWLTQRDILLVKAEKSDYKTETSPPSPAIDIPLSAKTKEEIIKRGPWYLVQIGEGMEQVGREAMLRENVLDAMEEYAQRQRAPAIEGKEEYERFLVGVPQ